MKRVAMAAAVVVLLSAAMVLAVFGSVTVRSELDPHRIGHVSGNIYLADHIDALAPRGYEIRGDAAGQSRQSDLRLLDNGKPLGPAHSVHATIRTAGKGSYSHWGSALYFSTAQNTDPRVDGHHYSIEVSAALTNEIRAAAAALAIVSAAALLWLLHRMGWAPALIRASSRLVTPLKLLAVAALLAGAPWIWAASIADELRRLALSGRYVFAAGYLLVVALALAAIVTAPFLKDWRIRVPLVVLMVIGFGTDQAMLAIAGSHLPLHTVEILWRERVMGPEAIENYRPAIIQAFVIAVVLIFPLALVPRRRFSAGRKVALISLAAYVAVAAMIYVTHGRTEAFPSPVGVPSKLVVAVAQSFSASTVQRDPVEYARTLTSPLRKIVIVVDESVRGDYLGLNNPKYDNTPYLSTNASHIANFGVSISGANCSVASRLMMRIGLRRDKLPDTKQVWRRMPTIWQFAHKAGYKTVLLDVLRPKDMLHSYMNEAEAKTIDEHIDGGIKRGATGNEYPRDTMAADILRSLLNKDDRALIYVNKFGAHPAYSNDHPPDMNYDASGLVAGLPLDSRQKEIVAEYHKALRWSVDGFFQRVLPAITQRDDTILIYTSDHGQSLFEGGYELSHCSLRTDLARGEVYVPLFVIAGSSALTAKFQQAAKASYDKASNFDIFPTVLDLMGYGHDWVTANYGTGLLNIPPHRERGFLLGTFYEPSAVWLKAEYPPGTAVSRSGNAR